VYRLAACASFFNDNIDNGDNGHTATCGVLKGAAAVVCVVIVVVKKVMGYGLWVMGYGLWSLQAGSLRSNVCRRDAGAPLKENCFCRRRFQNFLYLCSR
ncbi:MAG: hypothetical protein IKN29_01060, partial [Bacteroidales bacterium]|nr:hypothetical protein [Bacteroidales bacterium]